MRFIQLFTLLTILLALPLAYSDDEVTERVSITVQQGKEANNRQSFQVNTGEVVFIPIGQINLNVPTTPKPSAEELAYQTERAQLAQQIASKIAEIQAKQTQYDNELYIAYKPPILAEKQQLMTELQALEAQRDKIESNKVFSDTQKMQTEAMSPEKTAQTPRGMYVKPMVKEGNKNISINIRTQGFAATAKSDGEINSTIELPFSQWLQIPNQDIWIKVDKGR